MKELTKDKQLDLSIHGYAMDSDTACALHKIDGILELIRNAIDDVHIGDPVPDGVQSSVWAAHDILSAAMVRGGIKEATV